MASEKLHRSTLTSENAAEKKQILNASTDFFLTYTETEITLYIFKIACINRDCFIAP